MTIARRVLLAALPLLPPAARAQPAAWNPDRPIRLLVGFSAGGSTDTTARIIAQAIAPGLGQNVVVENRTGAGGNVASEHVARSAPDGTTLIMGSLGTHGTNQALYRDMPFHVVRDFSAVSLVALSYALLVVHPAVPLRTVAEVIAHARANPGKLNAGTGGGGTSQHFAAALFEHRADVRFTMVHYRGGAPAAADLVAGRVDLIFAPTVEVLEQVRAGKLRAVATSRPQPLEVLPEVPTIVAALPGYEFRSWLGVFAPAGTPAPVLARLSGEIGAAVRRPEVGAKLAALGYEPVGSTAAEFASFQSAELAKATEMVRLSGAAVN
jgi:tripartite-type tricarboxylate transporter receptor subunit TctC